MSHNTWAIVLAGEKGHSLKPAGEPFDYLVKRSFCAFCGNRSLFEQTVHRAIRVVGDRIVTVVNQNQFPHFPENLPGLVIQQPEDKGTAPGVFLATSYIRQLDENARILVMPSDHFVHPEERFLQQLQRMFFLSEAFEDYVILAAAEARGPDSGLSWIEPGDPLDSDLWSRTPVRKVSGFQVEPSYGETRDPYRTDSYLNTSIVAARAQTLWQVGNWAIPFLTDRFTDFLGALLALEGEPERVEAERGLISLLYRDMPEMDFSRDVLAAATGRSILYPLEGVYWSDWGRRERILKTIEELGHPPEIDDDPWQSLRTNASAGEGWSISDSGSGPGDETDESAATIESNREMRVKVERERDRGSSQTMAG